MKGIAFLAIGLAAFGIALAIQTNEGFRPREPPICPEPNGSIISFPNPDDCSTFYVCVGYEPVEIECQNGTWYNPEIQVCDWPENIEEGICIPPVEQSGDGETEEPVTNHNAEIYRRLVEEAEKDEFPFQKIDESLNDDN